MMIGGLCNEQMKQQMDDEDNTMAIIQEAVREATAGRKSGGERKKKK